jgi:hypothetical protein
MRRAVVLIGFLCGVLVALAALMLNPMAWSSSPPASAAKGARTLTYTPAAFRGFELRPMALLGVAGIDADGAGLADPAIRYARVEVEPLTADSSSAVALAVRLSSLAKQNSLFRARLGVITDWNVVWPDQGSLFLSGSENFWPVVRDCLWSLLRGRGFRPAETRYQLPPVPGGGTGQSVSGVRGSFAGAHGSFSEIFEPLPDSGADLGGRRILHITEARQQPAALP